MNIRGILLSVMVSACLLSFRTGIAGETYQLVDYFADNGFSNAVAPIQHPAGEYHNGVTYVAYQGPLEDPYVASYNHSTGEWAGPYKAGVSAMGKDPDHKIDNHGKPALIIDNEGYIHLVFGGHGGMSSHGKNPLGDTHYGEMKHVVSKKPLDITDWEELKNIPPFGTYTQLVKMDNGDIYLFYRHGAHKSNWVYQESSDNGRSFEPPVSILKSIRRTDIPAQDSWYAWFNKGPANKIIGLYNYHYCGRSDHRPQRHNGYYMEMDTTDHTWRNVKGELLTIPITREDSDERTLVADTGDLWAYGGTAALDSEGSPHATLYVGPDLGETTGGPKQVRHYRWTGEDWTGGGCPDLPVAVGDMIVFAPDEVNLLLARKDHDGTGTVAWWNSVDGGQSFKQGDVLLRLDKTGWGITSFIRNAHPDARVMVVARRGGSDFGRMYLLGDHGPVKRLKSEAEVLDD